MGPKASGAEMPFLDHLEELRWRILWSIMALLGGMIIAFVLGLLDLTAPFQPTPNGEDGPPYELFKRLRDECPVHWTEKITEYPTEAGFWSVTTADDIHAVSRDWQTYSSELGGVTAVTDIFPLELTRAMFIGMDPPKHDRIKRLFQRGFTPKRIAEHEDAIREITVGVLDRVEGREPCDLVTDVAQPVRRNAPSRRTSLPLYTR